MLGIPGQGPDIVRRQTLTGAGGPSLSTAGQRRTSSVNFLTAKPPGATNKESIKGFNEMPREDEKRQQELLRRAQQSFSRPTGILAVHVKHVNFINLNPASTSVYLRILVGKQIKCTCEYEGVVVPAKVILDELKHFIIHVSAIRSDPSNYMRMEVVAFDKETPQTHHILAMKELHLYEIIKRLYTVQLIEFHKMEKFVAEVDLEFCFSYGLFGYGYTNQFENRQKSPKESVQHSMFFRANPPIDRIDSYREIMLPRPVGHPGFIYFGKKVEIGDTVQRYRSDMSVHDWETVEEPVLLISRIRRKMHRMYTEYTEQTNRRARLDYLRNMVHGHVSMSNVNEGVIHVSEKLKLRRRQYHTQKANKASLVDEADAEDKLAFTADDIDTLTKVMRQAPGVQQRIRDIEYRQKKGGRLMPSKQRRRPSVGSMLGRLLTGKWRSEETEEAISDISVGAVKETINARADPQGVVRRPQPQTQAEALAVETLPSTEERRPPEASDTIAEEPDDTASLASTFGSRLLDTSAVIGTFRRPSIGQKGQSQARRTSVLESGVTRLRQKMNQKIEEEIPLVEFQIPRVMITPSTPELSEDSESEEDYF